MEQRQQPRLVHYTKAGDVEEVANILDEGAQVNARGDWGMEDGRAAIHFAVAGEHIEVAKLLITRGADVEIESKLKDDWGAAPIHLAAETGNCEMMELLLEHGASTETMDNEKLRAVHVAAAHGKLGILKVLHRYECDLNARTGDQSTVLHYAAGYGDLETVKWLIEKGVKHNLKKRGGKLPKDLAAMFGHTDVKKYLRDPFSSMGEKSARLSFRNSFRRKKKKQEFRPTQSDPNLHKHSEATTSLISPTLRGSESSSEVARTEESQRPSSQNTLTKSHSDLVDIHPLSSVLDSASSVTELSTSISTSQPPYTQSSFGNSRSSSRASGRHKSKRDQYGKQRQMEDNGIISNASNSRSSSRASGRHQTKREQFEKQLQASASNSHPQDHADTLEMISSLDSISRSSYRSSGRHKSKKQQQQEQAQEQANIRVLEEANESHIRTISNIEREAQELQNSLHAMTEQNHQYQREIDRLGQREMELVAMNDAQNNTIASHKLEIVRLSNDFKHIAETAHKSKAAHEDRIKTLEDRIRVLEERDKTNKRELERARDENENLSYMLQESGKTGSKALEYQEKYKNRMIELEQKEAEHEHLVANMRKELDNMSQQLLLANQKLLSNQERKNEGLQELLHQDASNSHKIAALKMEVENLSKKLTHSEQKCMHLQMQHQGSLSELLEQDSRNNQTIAALTANIETLTIKLTDAQRRLATSQVGGGITVPQSGYMAARENFFMNQEHLIELQNEVTASQQSVNTLRSQVEFLVAKLDNCQKDQQTKGAIINQQESTINSLRQQLAQATKDLAQSTEKLMSMQTAQQQILSRHRRDVDQKANERQIQQQATIQDLLFQDATKQAKIEQQKKDNMDLEEKLKRAQTALLEYQEEQKAKIKKLEDLEVTNRQTITSLMKEIEHLTKRLKDNTQTQQNAMLENRVKELEREAEAKNKALDDLTANNHYLKVKFNQETDQLNFLNNRVAELQTMLDAKSVNIEVLEKDNRVLSDKLKNMDKKQGNQSTLETRIVDLEAEREAKQMTINSLSAENKSLNSRLEETSRIESYTKRELQELRNQDHMNKQTITSLKKEIENLTHQLNDSQNNLVVSKNKLQDVDSSLRSTEEENKQIICSLEQKINRLQQELHECQIDVKTHQTKLMRAENQLMEAEKQKGNKAALEKRIVKLTQELQECKQKASKPVSEDECQKEIKSLNAIIGVKDTKIAVLEKKFKEKETQLIESQKALEQQDIDFNAWQENERRGYNQKIDNLRRQLAETTNKT